ncbi:DUF2510 domain-containing protein [Mycobacterium canettii]|uniref:DUF2510 domain-containing protein n=1 Tax=Mycobacterium canetti TaxID=78331 RepID=UPI0005C4C4ED
MTQSIPPGWYPDPSGAPGTRYWDGVGWTPHRAPPAQPMVIIKQSNNVVTAPSVPKVSRPNRPNHVLLFSTVIRVADVTISNAANALQSE